MNTITLGPETESLSIGHLLKQVSEGGVELRDVDGNIVAVVLSPTDQEAWAYFEARMDLDQHKQQVEESLRRRDGSTTSQLLKNAALAAENPVQQ